MGGGFGGGFGAGLGFPWMGLLLVVVPAVGIYVPVRVVARLGHEGHRPAEDAGPEADVRRRYARGEIGRDEYERVLRDLRR